VNLIEKSIFLTGFSPHSWRESCSFIAWLSTINESVRQFVLLATDEIDLLYKSQNLHMSQLGLSKSEFICIYLWLIYLWLN